MIVLFNSYGSGLTICSPRVVIVQLRFFFNKLCCAGIYGGEFGIISFLIAGFFSVAMSIGIVEYLSVSL